MARALVGVLYRNIAKPYLFYRDPEDVHDSMLLLGERLGKIKIGRKIVSGILKYEHPMLRQTIAGINFSNPIGLAGGFDKNGHLTQILPAVGFGFEEIGSITLEAAPGNQKPRLYRLPKSRGIVVNYGLANDGVDVILARLKDHMFGIPVGINIAKTNSPKTADKNAGVADYVGCFEKVISSGIGSYITINVSCPNAYGGESFTNPQDLKLLLIALRPASQPKPVFVKLPADISTNELDELLTVCKRYGINGIIISNLTKDRTSPAIDQEEMRGAILKGGISGKPTFERSNTLIRHAYGIYGKDFIIVGCGGVFSAQDAYTKIRLGASLVQLITGMIFMGPQLIGEINHGLVRLLKRDGFNSISEAIGKDVK